MKKRLVAYKKCLVSYVDILGFRQLVEQKSPAHISRVLRHFRNAGNSTRVSHRIKAIDARFATNFSDLWIVSMPLDGSYPGDIRGAIADHLYHLLNAQIRLLQDDILIRGAILVGKAELSYRQHFGPAVIAAYDMERKEMFPRIIVDDSLLKELKNPAVCVHPDVDEIFARSLITRENGTAFIDYLRVAAEQLSERYPGFVRKHRQVIDAGIRDAKDERVRKKYFWLHEYHERTIERRRRPRG